MNYTKCGNSGLKLPQISLGLWQNFGSIDSFENAEAIIKNAFDSGITHFDLANNYGPIAGSAETNFGKILKNNFSGFLRDQLVIATKAGYDMWDGPYGNGGSRKYMIASLHQSLQRMQLEYLDIFYSHRFDPETPLEETMMALDYAVKSGKALYAGISNYSPEQTVKAAEILKQLGTPCLIHQVKYSLFERTPEHGLLDVLEEKGIGCIAFSPLAQGLLTNRYLNGIPADSRVSKGVGFLKEEHLTPNKLLVIKQLDEIAKSRNQELAQMALAWVLHEKRITSVLIGASSVAQLEKNCDTLQNMSFTENEIASIVSIVTNV